MFITRGDQLLFVARSGQGPAVVFAHGLFGTHTDASWLAESTNSHTLVAPDLRGRGASRPSIVVEEHTFEAHAADVLAILDHLQIARAIVCGSSYGAAVAIAFALQHLERVNALLLIASAFGARADPMGEGDLAAYGHLGDRIAEEGLAAVARQESDRTGSTWPLQRWTQHDEASLVAWLRAVPRYRPFERITDLRGITVPTLVVPGGDSIHTLELSQSYAAALPQATMVDPPAQSEAIRSLLQDHTGE